MINVIDNKRIFLREEEVFGKNINLKDKQHGAENVENFMKDKNALNLNRLGISHVDMLYLNLKETTM